MKAIVQSGYGSPDRLALSELDMPVIGDAQVLVRVHASSQKIGNVARTLNGGRAR